MVFIATPKAMEVAFDYLIGNSVRRIDDEFLEMWFEIIVKRPVKIHQVIYDIPSATWRVWDGGDYTEVCVL